MNSTIQKLNAIHEHDLLLSLIKDHLVHTRLLNGLYAAGLETDHFNLDLSNTIFKLAALFDDEAETRYEHYLNMAERISHFGPEVWPQQVAPLAAEMLAVIVQWQQEDILQLLPYVEYE